MAGSTRTLLCAAISLLIPASCAFARAPQVIDRAGIYTASALKDANAIIAAIYSDYDVTVLVETTTGAPKHSVGEAIRRAWQRFFPSHRSASSSSERGDRTIYIRIARDLGPGNVQIDVGPDPKLQSAFPDSARVELLDLLLASLRQKRQAGLVDGLKLIRQSLADHLGAPLDWRIACTVLASLLAAWLALEGLRILIRPRQTDDPSRSLVGAGGFGPALFQMMIRGNGREPSRTDSARLRSESETAS